VHVLRDGRLVLKWNLDSRQPMQGVARTEVLTLIRQLESEGLL
jgi:hypothetical protein